MKRQTEVVERFFYWINERHRIYVKRAAGEEFPWTDDIILQNYKFTNVFRELDIGTVWYRENWREPHSDHPKLFFNTCLYRQFNYWPTAEYIGFIGEPFRTWDPESLEISLRTRKEAGVQVFTGAHMLTGTLGGPEKKDKVWQVVWAVLDHIINNEELYAPTLEDNLESAYRKILKAPGFGPFLAYEVVTDLRHTRYLQHADDIMTWANPGPGAMRGINRMYGLEVGKHPTKIRKRTGHRRKWPTKQMPTWQYVQIMQELLALSYDYLEDHVPMLEMREIEHSLCEFDKYERARTGEGRPRSLFIPPHARP